MNNPLRDDIRSLVLEAIYGRPTKAESEIGSRIADHAVDAILAAVVDAMPGEREVVIDVRSLRPASMQSWENQGYNACRTEILKVLGEKR